MVKKTKNTDILFGVTLLLGLLLHLYFVFIAPSYYDESYYPSVALRLLNGDSLVQHEWHLTQFSSLFSFLPVYIWTAIKGSTEWMFIFLRLVYLFIHTSVAVVIYRFFKKHGKWAVLASILFYIQMPYRIIAISYHSIFAISVLLLCLCLISIYEKQSLKLYVLAGLFFGCSCVCNPLFCLAFVLYLLGCVVWSKRQILIDKVTEIRISGDTKGKKLTKKQKKELKQVEVFPHLGSYDCFFNKQAILWFSCGILIAAFVATVYFFLTGGTISSILDNIDNLLGSSEYGFASSSIFNKIGETLTYFTKASLGMSWILPAMFIVMLFDKNRKKNTHRFSYLLVSLIWSAIFMLGVFIGGEIFLCGVSFPFFVISTVCYALTDNKNKVLFRCMYIPCLIGTLFHYFAGETHLAILGVVCAVNNVAGVFFVMDFFREMRSVSQEETEETENKKSPESCRKIIIAGLCLQILFYVLFYFLGQFPGFSPVKVTTGPYAGMYMTEEQSVEYNNAISDMDVIKSLTKDDEPVLMAAFNNWMYLYLDRPFATYTIWYQGGLSIDKDQLIDYYRKNPEKVPKYIYIESPKLHRPTIETLSNVMSEMFIFTEDELSNGALLTVEGRKF